MITEKLWRFRTLPQMDLPDRDGVIVAEQPTYVVTLDLAEVVVDFIPVRQDALLRTALGLATVPGIGTLTIHRRDVPAESTILAYALAQRLRLLSRSMGLVMIGVEPDDPEATPEGGHVVRHGVELQTPDGSRVERGVWEIMTPHRHAAWVDTRR
ncbi:conserved hypothetical protein [Frankia canadensis]|uniref:Uncharacterized protein n=1 Tax=Frankia canadensis TaxID=1836972 RepID=A0A2I2KUJ0_9ACTN|nr:hypothetical protein [Frankia canadensis]SNQ49333.1 conserved hypothetical protein [Frankia canadensis]SOU56623.1 conserved hypothetical protein [Frankia canadensis]